MNNNALWNSIDKYEKKIKEIEKILITQEEVILTIEKLIFPDRQRLFDENNTNVFIVRALKEHLAKKEGK